MDHKFRKAFGVLGAIVLIAGLSKFSNIDFFINYAAMIITDPLIRVFYDRGTAIRPSAGANSDNNDTEKPGITAKVLIVPPAISFGNIIVSAGSDDGVSSGMVAVTENDVLVGIVEEVFPNSSRLRTLAGFGKLEQVRIDNVGLVTTEGLGGTIFKIELPQNTNLPVGAPVEFGHGDNSFLAGLIYAITQSGSKPLSEARAILPFNAYELDSVLIIP